MSKKSKKVEKAAAEDGTNGVFSNDFPIYCTQQGLPAVPVRILPRSEVPDTPLSPAKDAQSSSRILVETDPLDTHSIKKIQLRNVLLDQRVLAALTSALEGTQLATLILWNVGLTDDILSGLLPLVTSCNIRRLVLDGNPISPQQVMSILRSTSLEQLSLKCCCLGDAFCAAISSALAANRTVIALDLSSNQITDIGVEQLANALRLNRTLLSLCLAGNRIGDEGVKAICLVLRKFRLNKEEEIMRKSLLSSTESGTDSLVRSPSAMSLDKLGRGSRGGTGKSKKDLKKDDKSGRSSAIRGGRGSKAVGSKKGSVKTEETDDPQQGPSVGGGGGSKDPLVELVSEEKGQLWMQGNSVLAHLTLSCNQIGVRGVASLLEVLKAQQDSTLSSMTSEPSSPEVSNGTGLLRVTLQHNNIPVNSTELIEMTSLLQSRDPLATPTLS